MLSTVIAALLTAAVALTLLMLVVEAVTVALLTTVVTVLLTAVVAASSIDFAFTEATVAPTGGTRDGTTLVGVVAVQVVEAFLLGIVL